MKKPDNIRFEIRKFTNAQIETLLESENWRPLDTTATRKLYQAMRDGKWRTDNGETIVLDPKGRLLDGQHRLAAAAKYQAEHEDDPVWFWCAVGVEPSAAPTLDGGTPRRFAQWLVGQHIPNAKTCATITAAAVRQRNAQKQLGVTNLTPVVHGSYLDSSVKEAISASVEDMTDYWKRHRGEIEYWAKQKNNLWAVVVRPDLIAALMYQFALVDDTNAKLFCDQLISGVGLERQDPILQLRNRMSAEKSANAKSTASMIAALTIKAWTAWMRGEPIDSLRWRIAGPRAEEFPDHRDIKGA